MAASIKRAWIRWVRIRIAYRWRGCGDGHRVNCRRIGLLRPDWRFVRDSPQGQASQYAHERKSIRHGYGPRLESANLGKVPGQYVSLQTHDNGILLPQSLTYHQKLPQTPWPRIRSRSPASRARFLIRVEWYLGRDGLHLGPGLGSGRFRPSPERPLSLTA